MYSSCLVCHSELGQNDEVSAFNVGRRLAFSPEDGRLWAICDSCGEWNLAPIDKRWEAVEECQAIYDGSLERASAGELSVARADRLELIRVGSEGELPTLRYGARLRRRGRRQTRIQRVGRASVLLSLLAAPVAGAVVGGFPGAMFAFVGWVIILAVAGEFSESVGTRIPIDDRAWTDISRRELRDARLVPRGEDGWALRVRKGLELEDDVALETARLVLPLLSWSSDPGEALERALSYIEKKGGTTDSVFAAAARRRGRHRTARIAKLEPHIRLALEMLASRDVEQRALSQSLRHLQLAWEHADQLAVIQDDLAYGPNILRAFRELKG